MSNNFLLNHPEEEIPEAYSTRRRQFDMGVYSCLYYASYHHRYSCLYIVLAVLIIPRREKSIPLWIWRFFFQFSSWNRFHVILLVVNPISKVRDPFQPLLKSALASFLGVFRSITPISFANRFSNVGSTTCEMIRCSTTIVCFLKMQNAALILLTQDLYLFQNSKA